MRYILLVIGLLVTGFSWAVMGLETSGQGSTLGFLVGIVLLLVGMVMALRSNKEQ